VLSLFEVHNNFLIAEWLNAGPLVPDQVFMMLFPPCEQLYVLS